MRHKYILRTLIGCALLLGILFFTPPEISAHCDTMDGPVVRAAQRALKTGNINPVLIWIQKKDEAEIKRRFWQTLTVRKLNRPARELADAYFFETVVRLHRAGEGEPYTGLRPAGTDLGPVIPVADKALQAGSLDGLMSLFAAPAHEDIRKRFTDVLAKRQFKETDVDAGREYVKAYITFMHYVEHLYEETRHS